MASNPLHVDTVFGVSRDLPLNYVHREYVDNVFIDNLSRSKHIAVYDGSKQGKTSLRKACFKPEDYIIVQCSNRWGIADLNTAILKAAGFNIQQSTKRAANGKQKITASFGSNLFQLLNIGVGAERETGDSTEVTSAPLDLDPEDTNDIIAALNSIDFNRFVVLEDFHYLSDDTQRDFSISLKAYHESSSYIFIIIGVWLEGDRLSAYNGDLLGRVVSIDADKWTHEDLRRVIAEGEKILNIRLSDEFKMELIDKSLESVYIVQEACLRACKSSGIYYQQEEERDVAPTLAPEAIIKAIVNQNNARYSAFLTNFANGFQDTQLEMYKWILYPVISSSREDLESGLKLNDMSKAIKPKHPEGQKLNIGNLTQALKYSANLQISKNITPLILDYDQTNRVLNVVDRQFLIWFSNQDKEFMYDCVGLEIIT